MVILTKGEFSGKSDAGGGVERQILGDEAIVLEDEAVVMTEEECESIRENLKSSSTD